MNSEYVKTQIEKLRRGDVSALSTVYGQLYPKPQKLVHRLLGKVERNSLVQTCAGAAAEYMSRLSDCDLIHLRESFSQRTSMEWYADWGTASASEMAARVLDSDARFYTLALGTFHPNGYFRQRCLRELEQYGGRALPYAFLLVNNWVAPIREEAAAISLRLLEAATVEEILKSLNCLERITLGRRRNRDSADRIYELVGKRLQTGGTLSPDQIMLLGRGARRICYRLLLEGFSEADKAALLARESDSHSRLLIAKQLLSGELSESMWERLLNGKSAPIRYLALQAKHRRLGLWDGIEEFLFDSNQTIREYVSFQLRKQGVDVAGLYRSRMMESPSVGVLLGLGESGSKEDAALIQPFFEDPRPALRKAALTATANLTAGDFGDLLYRHLEHEWSGKTAYRLILRGKYRYSARQCYESYSACENDVLSQRYFRLLLRCGSWDKLPYLIRLYPTLPEELKETAAYHLERWQPGFTKPSEEQKRLIAEEMAAARLPHHLTRLMEFSLQASGYMK